LQALDEDQEQQTLWARLEVLGALIAGLGKMKKEAASRLGL
jgi:hypothetical protein